MRGWLLAAAICSTVSTGSANTADHASYPSDADCWTSFAALADTSANAQSVFGDAPYFSVGRLFAGKSDDEVRNMLAAARSAFDIRKAHEIAGKRCLDVAMEAMAALLTGEDRPTSARNEQQDAQCVLAYALSDPKGFRLSSSRDGASFSFYAAKLMATRPYDQIRELGVRADSAPKSQADVVEKCRAGVVRAVAFTSGVLELRRD